MRSIAVDWGDKLRAGHLTKYEAWAALNTRVMKTLLYAAPALTITNTDANHIMAPILMSGLNALGMQRFLPRAVVYAPLNIKDLLFPISMSKPVSNTLHFCCKKPSPIARRVCSFG